MALTDAERQRRWRANNREQDKANHDAGKMRQYEREREKYWRLGQMNFRLLNNVPEIRTMLSECDAIVGERWFFFPEYVIAYKGTREKGAWR